MKLRIILVLAIIFLPFFRSCTPVHNVLLETGEMNFHHYNRYDPSLDNLTGAFTVSIRFDYMVLGSGNTVTAFSYNMGFLNSIDLESIELSLDRPCSIKGEVYESGENIIADFYPTHISMYDNYLDITFTEDKLHAMEFEDGETIFKVTGKNSDNVRFEFEKTVLVDL